MKYFALPVVALLAAAGSSFGQVTLLSQTRHADGLAHINFVLMQPVDISDSFSDSFADPGPYSFADTAAVTASNVTVSTSVDHTSLITTSEMSFESTLTASYSRLPSMSEVRGSGEHSFFSRFRVDSPVEYSLNAGLSYLAPQGVIEISLRGPGVEHYITSSFGSTSLSESGVLQPGEYTFWATSNSFSFSGGVGEGQAYSSFFSGSLTFVPAPGAAVTFLIALGTAARRRR